MGLYTREQREWLDNRFRLHDEHGYYLAHQPIYGFRVEPSEPGHTFRYTITYQIIKALEDLRFDTILDAGGGEGYKAHLFKRLRGVKATLSDLSEEACCRARDLFDLPAVTADLHDLPFRDGAFDVVLCSESLEHVEDYQRSLEELLRITGKALVITVPHEDHGDGHPDEPHAHINTFSPASLSFLRDRGYRVRSQRLLSPLLTIPASLADASPRSHNPAWKHPRWMTGFYNTMVPLAQKILGISTVSLLVRLDALLCRWLPWHNGILYVITKNCDDDSDHGLRAVSIQEMLDETVPLYRIKNRDTVET